MLSLFNSRTHNNQIVCVCVCVCVRACVRACVRVCVCVCVCLSKIENFTLSSGWFIDVTLKRQQRPTSDGVFRTLYVLRILLLLDMNSPFSTAFLTNE